MWRRIFLLGWLMTMGAGIARGQFWTVDPAFAPVLERAGSAVKPQAFVRQPSGKLLIAGTFDRVNGSSVPDRPALFRFNPDGSTDAGFVAPAFAANTSLSLLQCQPTGKVVVLARLEGAGPTTFLRLNVDGALDSTFTSPERMQTLLAMDPTGRMYGSPGDGTLLRYSPDGVLDASFAPTVTVELGVTFVAPFADGTVAVVTRTSPLSSNRTVQRLRTDGSVDPSFVVNRNTVLFPTTIHGLVALPDGQVLLFGTSLGLRFQRFARDGTNNYTYLGPSTAGSQFAPADGLVLAGALHDLLAEAKAGDTRLAVSFVALNTGVSVTLDVGANDVMHARLASSSVATAFGRYARDPASALTIDARPTIQQQFPVATFSVQLGSRIGSLTVVAGGLLPLSYQWFKDGVAIPEGTGTSYSLVGARAEDAGTYTVRVTNAYGTVTGTPVPLTVNTTPAPLVAFSRVSSDATGRIALEFSSTGNPVASYQWSYNGLPVTTSSEVYPSDGSSSSATSTFLNFSVVRPDRAGLYAATATNAVNQVTSTPFVMGVTSTAKTVGAAADAGVDIHHPNGNIFDQVLLTGGAATITADPGQVARTSFVDLNGDIVQVEFSGAGSLTLVLDPASAPAPAQNYNQPGVNYITGHASLVVWQADETTNLSIFSVGRITAVNQALFRDGVAYDGMADLAFVAIHSSNGRFGGLRAGNANFFATRGYTGIYAPGVTFSGPVVLGDIDAHDNATPLLAFFATADPVRIAGGDLAQSNGQRLALQAAPSPVARLTFSAGSNSHGATQPAQANRARFSRDGADATDQVTITGP